MTKETLIRHSNRIQKAKKSITKNLDKLNNTFESIATKRAEFFAEILRPNDRCMDAVAKCVEAASAVTGVANEKLAKYENHISVQLEALKTSNDADGHYTWKELEGAFDDSPRNRKKTTGETVNDAARKIWDEDIVINKTARDLEWLHACHVISRTEESAVAIALRFMLATHIVDTLQYCGKVAITQDQLSLIPDETVKSLVVDALKDKAPTTVSNTYDVPKVERLWKEIESYNDEPGATIAWATDKINHVALDCPDAANELRKRLVNQVVSTLRVRCNDNHEICCFIDSVEDDNTRNALRQAFASLYANMDQPQDQP